MATIYQVAERAGVSLSTVSRVLNGRKTVNAELKAKVDKAMQELNYRPSSVARSLATNRTDSVGVLVSELHTPFFGEMMQAVEMTLREQNKHVIISVGHNDSAKEKDAIEFLISRKCDALILHSEAMTDDFLRQLNQEHLPIALINRHLQSLEQACFCLDNEQGGYVATSHLIDLGHKHIAYLAGPSIKEDARQRLAGHKRALLQAGIEFNQDLVYEGHYMEEDGIRGLQQLRARKTPFTALVCANDWMASGAISYAWELGLKLPHDLSIVGFDDVVIAHHVHPKLTTVCNPIYAMGEMAAKYILNHVYGEKNNLQQLYEAKLVVRDSAVKCQ